MQKPEDEFEQIFIKILNNMIYKCHKDMTADEIMNFCCELIKNYDANLKICMAENNNERKGIIATYSDKKRITLYKNMMVENKDNNIDFISCINTIIHECRHAYQDKKHFLQIPPHNKFSMAIIGACKGHLKDKSLCDIILNYATHNNLISRAIYQFNANEIDARYYADKITKKFLIMLEEYLKETNELSHDFVQTNSLIYHMRKTLDKCADVQAEIFGLEARKILYPIFDSEQSRLYSQHYHLLNKNNFTVANFLGTLTPFANNDADEIVKMLTKHKLFGYASIINNNFGLEEEIYKKMMLNGDMHQIGITVKELAMCGSDNMLKTFVDKYVDSAIIDEKVRSKTKMIVEKEKAKAAKEFNGITQN